MTDHPPFGDHPLQAGYGRPAPFNLGEALGWAWNKFTKNPAATVFPVLIIGVAFAVVFTLLSTTMATGMVLPDGDTAGSAAELDITTGLDYTGMLVFNVVAILLGAAFTSAYYSGALELADGKPVTVGSFLRPRRLGAVVVVMLIIGVVSSLLNWLIVLPANDSGSAALSFLATAAALAVAIAIALFTMFAVMALLDREFTPVEALKFSIAVVRQNFGTAATVLLVAGAICVVGALLCGVGLLIAAPVAILLQVYTWRRLTGGPIAPIAA